jgi:hypothetical protein
VENIKTAIHNQWQTMLNYGKIPMFEIELSNGDYLIVDIVYKQGDDFISFYFDDSLPVFFDGEIKKHGGGYRIMLDDCFDNLDSYLQLIYNNIIEGYIIPNDLLLCEDE